MDVALMASALSDLPGKKQIRCDWRELVSVKCGDEGSRHKDCAWLAAQAADARPAPQVAGAQLVVWVLAAAVEPL